jgi:hypothetical protein
LMSVLALTSMMNQRQPSTIRISSPAALSDQGSD